MRRKFHTLDVFTDKPFAGNPLAVVMEAQGLDGARMQALAREFNLSETVFVLEPHDPVNTARLRIFTPAREIPFAGHPTIGTAVLLARLRAPDLMAREDLRIVLEEGIGSVDCSVRQMRGRAAEGRFVVPQLPWSEGEVAGAAEIARALNLSEDDIGFEAHVPTRWSAGNAFTFVPLRSLDAMARARPDLSCFAQVIGGERPAVFLYTSQVEREGSHVHARMFAPSRLQRRSMRSPARIRALPPAFRPPTPPVSPAHWRSSARPASRCRPGKRRARAASGAISTCVR